MLHKSFIMFRKKSKFAKHGNPFYIVLPPSLLQNEKNLIKCLFRRQKLSYILFLVFHAIPGGVAVHYRYANKLTRIFEQLH